MTTNAIEATVSNNAARRRYEAIVAPASIAGFLEYQETRKLVISTRTDVDPAFEGQETGRVLARSHPDYFDVLYNAPKPARTHQDGPA